MSFLKSSIGKKHIVAVTGLMLLGFVMGHLAGNLFLYAGPEAFNAYAKKLTGMRPAFLVVEFGLGVVFLVHAITTFLIIKENRKARPKGYAVSNSRGPRSFATKIMPYTGTIILAFLVWHLIDFTFSDHHGPRGIIDGIDMGLYGVVYNSFKSPIHALLYILAMPALGFHLAHGIHSCIQTFGWSDPVWTPRVKKLAIKLAVLISLGFMSLPIYVYFGA